jgi:hypothetical protein
MEGSVLLEYYAVLWGKSLAKLKGLASYYLFKFTEFGVQNISYTKAVNRQLNLYSSTTP